MKPLDEQIAKLFKIVDAATDGPWDEDDGFVAVGGFGLEEQPYGFQATDYADWTQRDHDAEFIAQFNPATVRKLLAVVKAAKEMREDMDHVEGSDPAVVASFDAALAKLDGLAAGEDKAGE